MMLLLDGLLAFSRLTTVSHGVLRAPSSARREPSVPELQWLFALRIYPRTLQGIVREPSGLQFN